MNSNEWGIDITQVNYNIYPLDRTSPAPDQKLGTHKTQREPGISTPSHKPAQPPPGKADKSKEK